MMDIPDDLLISDLQNEVKKLKASLAFYQEANHGLNWEITELRRKLEELTADVISLEEKLDGYLSQDDVLDVLLPPHLVGDTWARETAKKMIKSLT